MFLRLDYRDDRDLMVLVACCGPRSGLERANDVAVGVVTSTDMASGVMVELEQVS